MQPGCPARKKGSYIQAQFHRIRSRGAKKAIGAVAASILTAIYHILKNGICHSTSAANTPVHSSRCPHARA